MPFRSFRYLLYIIALLFCTEAVAQEDSIKLGRRALDSTYIAMVEERKEPPKVLHAEPLFIDLIRDLGARKGEKEWNVGFGLTDRTKSDEYLALVEYEWAPIDRLGLEIELPFSLYYPQNGSNRDSISSSRLNSLKLAAQYTFFVSEKINTSLAVGYLHEFTMTEFRNYGKTSLFNGNIFNPFFIAAKRWGNNFHTLIYTGPEIFKPRIGPVHALWQINTNFHYMISGTRNFIGVELNKEVSNHGFDMTIRPQMRLGISETVMIGIVTGIPISRENERFSSFLRLIYEPKH